MKTSDYIAERLVWAIWNSVLNHGSDMAIGVAKILLATLEVTKGLELSHSDLISDGRYKGEPLYTIYFSELDKPAYGFVKFATPFDEYYYLLTAEKIAFSLEDYDAIILFNDKGRVRSAPCTLEELEELRKT